jgi:hypothetical protein
MQRGQVHRRQRYRGSTTDRSTRSCTIGRAVEALGLAVAAAAAGEQEEAVVMVLEVAA